MFLKPAIRKGFKIIKPKNYTKLHQFRKYATEAIECLEKQLTTCRTKKRKKIIEGRIAYHKNNHSLLGVI